VSATFGRENPGLVAVTRGTSGYGGGGEVSRQVEATLAMLDFPSDFWGPGQKVVLKPNWVKEHDERRPGPGAWEHVVTHPEVIESVASWVAGRLEGAGSVTICDAPQTDSSFTALRRYCGLDGMMERLRSKHPGVEFRLVDLRPEEWHAVDGVTVAKTALPGDPAGDTRIELNEASEFVGYGGLGRLYGASYDMEETNRKHAGTTHEYLLCRTPMEADIFINLPKLKTHKKVGLTCALKNLVGINANKNWLPHHTEGTPDLGGDQFPLSHAKARLEHRWMGAAKRWLKHRPGWSRFFVPLKKAGRWFFGDTQKVVRSGNWHGNDTCWRMVLDLNKCLFFFDGEGKRRPSPRKYLAVVDGIVAGEGNGPMAPDRRECGLILAGTHPLAVDCVAASAMGFEPERIRLLERAFRMRELRFADFSRDAIRVVSNVEEWTGGLGEFDAGFRFKPHFGWVGAIEKREGVPKVGNG